MTYLDDQQGYEPDIYPPRPPGPAPRGRGIIGAMGFQSRRTQENEARKWQYFYEQQRVYAQKVAERQQREREHAAKEQDRMEREHRAEQVKIAEQRSKLDQSIAKQKYWQDELEKLDRQQQQIGSTRPKTSAQLATDRRQIEVAKKNLSKATEDLDNFSRQMEPLMKGLRGKRPADVDYKQYKENEQQALERYRVSAAPPKTVPGYFGGFFGDSTNPEYTKYKKDEQTALDLYRGTSKTTKAPGESARPGFKSTYGAYEAAREGVPIAEEKLAEQQDKLERANEEFQRTRMAPIDERRLAAERGLSEEAAKQQAAKQILGAYKNEGQDPGRSQAPQVVSGGNTQGGQPLPTPAPPRMQPSLGMPQSGVSAGGKGAIPIPIIGPILSSLAGGKGAGGVMGRPGQQMAPQAFPRTANVPLPPSRPQDLAGVPLPPSRPQEGQQPMQAGSPPAIDQPAGVERASYEGQPITVATPGGPQSAAGYQGPQESGAGGQVVVGDSIADGIRQGLGAQGDTKVGRSPQQVLEAITSNAGMFSGKDVILSSGASNDPKSMGILAKQLKALKAAGAKSISVMGVGDRKDFRGLNDQIENIARSSGARFLGPLQGLSKDHVHPRSYQNIINQIRRPRPGVVNDRGAPATAPRGRPGGGTYRPPIFTQLQGGITPQSMGGSDADRRAIAGIESGGSYSRLGPVTHRGDRAYGKYQVMGSNVGPWTSKYFGQWLNPQQFLSNPQAQEAVFGGEFGRLKNLYGGPGAARAWFAGEGGMNKPGRRDQFGTSVADYGRRYSAAAGGGGATTAPTPMMAGANIPPPQASTPSAQVPQQQPQKQQNPIAAGLSAIQPAKPTVEMTEPSPLPPMQPPQKTPFVPLPFAPEKGSDMDFLAHGALMRGMSRKDVAALMKKTMPNDQIPPWLMEQQQQGQAQNAGE